MSRIQTGVSTISKTRYIQKDFQPQTLKIIDQANSIIDEYKSEGLSLTLRQLYYQFVARGLIPNRQNEYNRLGNIMNEARLAGLVNWRAIEDRTRNVKRRAHWDTPADILHSAASSFRLDRWEGQEQRPEVWIEKEALIGVISKTCNTYDVPYFACKGYVSQSEMWRAAERFKRFDTKGIHSIVLHLGDHDPSGIDMTRDIRERLKLFGADITLRRLALTKKQINKYGPPPNPAKFSDSRYRSYRKKYGNKSWELDALEPKVIQELIRRAVLGYRDEEIFLEIVEQEKEYKRQLEQIATDWEESHA
jgi:hypothetical protein